MDIVNNLKRVWQISEREVGILDMAIITSRVFHQIKVCVDFKREKLIEGQRNWLKKSKF